MDDRAVRFHNRATILFVLLAVVAAIGLVLMFALELRWPIRAFLVTTDGLVIAGSAVLIRGLDHDRPWAVPATVVACWLLIVSGVVEVVYDLTHSTITFPLAAIGAVIVLLADPRPDARPQDRVHQARRGGGARARRRPCRPGRRGRCRDRRRRDCWASIRTTSRWTCT